MSIGHLDALIEGLVGDRQARRRVGAAEFSDSRRYVLGDDPRAIDWNAYARLRELFVTTSAAEGRTRLSLLVDCSASMGTGTPSKLHHAKRAAAALGAISLLRAEAVQVHALAGGAAVSGPVLHGSHALGELLALLEELRPSGRTDLPASVRAAVRGGAHDGLAVLVSDLLVPLEQDRALVEMARGTRVAVVLALVDPADAALPDAGAVELHDVETGEVLVVAGGPAVRAAYEAAVEERLGRLLRRCDELGITHVRLRADAALLDVLIERAQAVDLIRH